MSVPMTKLFVFVGSMTTVFTGISGRFELAFAQEAPRFVVRNRWPGVVGVSEVYPEKHASALFAFVGSIAIEVTYRSGSGDEVTFDHVDPVFVVTWTRDDAVLLPLVPT